MSEKIKVYVSKPPKWALYIAPKFAIHMDEVPNKKHRLAQEQAFGFKYERLDKPRKC